MRKLINKIYRTLLYLLLFITTTNKEKDRKYYEIHSIDYAILINKTNNVIYKMWCEMHDVCYNNNHPLKEQYHDIEVAWDWNRENRDGLYNFIRYIKMNTKNNKHKYRGYTLKRKSIHTDFGPYTCNIILNKG